MEILIAGAGQMGDYYAAILKKLGLPADDIVFFDIDLEKSIRLAQKHGAAVVASIDKKYDAAIVAVNTPAHTRVIKQLREFDTRNILCEKPLGLTPRDVEQIKRVQGNSNIFTALVINFSPALIFLRELMEHDGMRPFELHGTWGKYRPLDKNVRPSAGDVEDESVHPIAFALALIASQINCISVSARVGHLPFVDPVVQEHAYENDKSFPLQPNHSTTARMRICTASGEVPVDIRSSFLLARQTRQVGGVLGRLLKPSCAFQVDFDQQGADVLTISNRDGTREERFTADKLGDVTAAFIEAARGGSIDPRLATVEYAGLLVKIGTKILQSDLHKGTKVWLHL